MLSARKVEYYGDPSAISGFFFCSPQRDKPAFVNVLPVKNAIHAAKNGFSKVEYLKNLFQYNTVIARIWELSGRIAS